MQSGATLLIANAPPPVCFAAPVAPYAWEDPRGQARGSGAPRRRSVLARHRWGVRLRTPRRLRGVSRPSAKGVRLSALHRGISRAGPLAVKGTKPSSGGPGSARGGGHEPRRRGTAPGSAFRTVSGRRPSMSRDVVGLTSYRTIVKRWRQSFAKSRVLVLRLGKTVLDKALRLSATPTWRRWFAKRTESSTMLVSGATTNIERERGSHLTIY